MPTPTMERTWSAESVSPMIERPTYDLNKPRKHARRSSNQDAAASSSREWRKSKPGPSRRLSQSVAPSSALRKRSVQGDLPPTMQRSLPAHDGVMMEESSDALETDSSTEKDNRANSADPSGGAGYLSSSDDANSSSEFEAFKWDVAHKRGLERPRSWILDSSASPAVGQGSSSTGNTLKVPTRSGTATGSSPKKTLLSLPPDTIAAANGRQVHDKKASPPISAGNTEMNPQGRKRKRKRLRINPSIEALMMVGAAGAAYWGLSTDSRPETQCHAFELGLIAVASTAYFFLRDPSEQGAIWATDQRNYRACNEDGALNALLLGPLLATTSLFSAINDQLGGKGKGMEDLPNPPWMIEGTPPILHHKLRPPNGMTWLVLSRYSLISLMCLTSTALLLHLLATKWIKRPHEFPASNWKKLGSFTGFAMVISILLELVREVAVYYGLPLWANLNRWEVVTASLLFQANLYTISRLARKSFTLGELGIVASVGVTLSMETINLCIAKLLPVTTPYIKTFRRPTPLLIFQLALIVGTFMIGFLLSPLLYLSRNLAQKPTHRLRWPDKRDLHRRLLAGFFYLFAAVYVVGVLGMWVRWMLVRHDPWICAAQFLLKGHKPWSRLMLVAYWATLVGASIFGWQVVVARAKRFRGYGRSSGNTAMVPASEAPAGMEVVDASKRPSGAGIKVSPATKEAPLKKAAHLSLNARRKFFHALAVLLFVPGIALDPAFTHLAFSLAFSIFIFAEYVRYYALYPFGASMHVFMSEFLDHKDSGPVILSHFYLLTGCAGPLWLEGKSQILHQTGVLVLGVGDALASVVGRRYGRVYWPASSKTVEGSVAFFASIVSCAWGLRAVGLCEHFSLWRYSLVISVLGLLEGVSDQNDNLLLPIFAIIVSSLIGL